MLGFTDDSTEYTYDKLGNMQTMQSANKWTRECFYDSVNKNKLLSHDEIAQAVQYTYDAQGNMLSMPGIQSMEWDYVNQLHRASVTDENSTKIAYYNYDSGGQRAKDASPEHEQKHRQRLASLRVGCE